MAEKNVSGPPVPTARSTKPVSEALLNEKVRGAALSKSHTNAALRSSMLYRLSSENALKFALRRLKPSRAPMASLWAHTDWQGEGSR